jgi:hypothetical protein
MERHSASATVAAMLVLALVACSTAAPQTPGPTGSGTAPTGAPGPGGSSPPVLAGPSRASVIQQAVAEGRLDQVTGLIYRAYSALGMPGLPEEFAGAAPLRDDGVLASMAALNPELSAEDQARLEPFLVRPTDPQSIFHAQPTALVGGALIAEDVHPTAQCSNWADSADLDTRFKVWACADNDTDAAELDIATVVVLVDSIWAEMIKGPPDGMGPPKADTVGPDPSNEHGGDGRIDFYLLALGQVIHRDDEDKKIEDDDVAAQATSTDPYSGSTASGFVLLNRARLVDEIDMRQDVIHEFFHVLQFAQNVEAPFGPLHHWFVEASATWSEVFYDEPHSERPHGWFGTFQKSPAGLETTDPDHTYSAYIWPFFMQQEKKAASVFNAWAAIGQLGDGTYEAVSGAISKQLPFKENFHEFAVRNLNVENALAQAGVKTYDETDKHFWENDPPTHMVSATIVPGEPYIAPPGGAAPLAADYYSFEVTEPAREVTISMVNVSPSDQVDGDALAHIAGGRWERRPLSGGMLKFCRDNPPDNIDAVVLVVSNHGREQPLNGSVEASAKDSCSGPSYVGGTITWNAKVTQRISPDLTIVTTVSGRAELVLLAEKNYGFTAERGGGSTYAYDYDVSNCTPIGHLAGTLETSTQSQPAGSTIGTVLIQGAPGQDLGIALLFNDEWEATCSGFTSTEGTPDSFPGCGPDDWVTAKFDGVENYNIDCETSKTAFGYTLASHVNGTLHPLEATPPSP